jgi:hypothetical protein
MAASLVASGQAIQSSFPVAPAGTAFLGGLEFDCNSGIVWIVDETNDIVSAYDAAGHFLKSYPAIPPPGSAVTAPQPIGVGINAATGMLWVGDEAEVVYELNPHTGAATGIAWPTTPAITDVSGVAVNPLTGNVYVAQDSGTPRKIVEFTPSGAVVQTINLPATGSSADPDGLAYDVANNWFYLGDDTANTIYRVDATGATLASWNLTAINVSPEGLGIDPVNGLLWIGDGFVTRMVYAVSGIVAPAGPCVPGPSTFYVSVTTTPGTGSALVIEQNVPPSTVEGWTFFSLDTALPVGSGPIFGFSPDANSFQILSLVPVAAPGNVLHWTWPAAGLFPSVPLALPPGTMTVFAGQTWDFLAVAVDGAFSLTPTFNVSRVTW